MMGTGDFAVPTFRAILDRGDRVSMLVTQPDRPQGRHQELVAAPIKQLAERHSIPVFQPESVNTAESIARLAASGGELLVVAAYGQILNAAVLQSVRLGGINLHASLLPKYRGAAPINWAIFHGETSSGVTVIRMSPFLDAGGVLLQAETPIGWDETAGQLELRLAEIAAQLALEAIDGLAAGKLAAKKQDRSLATKAPKLSKEHGLIDWRRPAPAVWNQIRAMQPWPMAYSHLFREGREIDRIIIEHAVPERAEPAGTPPLPGTVREAEGVRLVVQCGEDVIRLTRLRPAGKRSLSAEELLRGRRIQVGDRFGNAPNL